MASLRIFLIAILLAVGLCACQKHDSAHPLYVRAQKMLLDNDFQEAARCFSQYLEIYPQSASAHKELGTIYDDRLKEPVLAIYHYRKFLEFAPPNHPDRTTVSKWIEAIEQKYYLQMKNRYNDPDDLKSTRVRYEMTREELDKLKTDAEQYRRKLIENQDRIRQDNYFIAKLKQQNATLIKESTGFRQSLDDQTQRNDSLEKSLAEIRNVNTMLHQDIARLRELLPRLQKAAVAAMREMERVQTQIPAGPWRGIKPSSYNSNPAITWFRKYEADPFAPGVLAANLERMPLPPQSTITTMSPIAPREVLNSVPVPNRTYTVRSGDTLSAISKKLYGSSRHVQKILDANRKTLSEPSALRSGQVLEIPAVTNP